MNSIRDILDMIATEVAETSIIFGAPYTTGPSVDYKFEVIRDSEGKPYWTK